MEGRGDEITERYLKTGRELKLMKSNDTKRETETDLIKKRQKKKNMRIYKELGNEKGKDSQI